jgi:hypothetical protein
VSFYRTAWSRSNYEYVQQMTDELLDDKTQLWLTGRLVVLDRKGLSEQITVYNSIKKN